MFNRKRAREENLMFAQGIEPPVEWAENDPIHMNEIMRYLCSPDFYALKDPQKSIAREAAQRHYDTHKTKMLQAQPPSPLALPALMGQQPGQGGGGLVPGSMPTGDGRIFVPQERPGMGKSSNHMAVNVGAEVPTTVGAGAA
jgi:hypothetical protein